MKELSLDDVPKSGMVDVCPFFHTEACGQTPDCSKEGEGCPLKSEGYY